LYVVLQDYRFLLLDAFLRLAANGALAGVAVAAIWQGRVWWPEWSRTVADPTLFGLSFVAGALGLIGFSMLRQRVQEWLTRQVFLRRDPAEVEGAIRNLAGGEEEMSKQAGRLVAEYFSCSEWSIDGKRRPGFAASAPLRYLKGDEQVLQLGERAAGRIFLSEDVAALERFANLLAREVDRCRTQELERLVMQAELRALQSQIHPHFLFNALNALYGSIPRAAGEARQLVLSLSEVFRYFLTTSKTMVRLEEELNIVTAYLEIEKARLGPRLEVRMDVGKELMEVRIPVLSVQPLVENAIQHGVSAQPGPGWVSVGARREGGMLLVEIRDSGPGLGETSDPASNRVGLENLRRRLELTYGSGASLEIWDARPGVVAELRIPAGGAQLAAGQKESTVGGEGLGVVFGMTDAG
jgi:two-component system, LytTR family, sensor kinase